MPIAVQHEMLVLDDTGDTKLVWDADNQEEIDAAKAMWTRLKGKGFIAFSVNSKGDRGKVLDEFDPNAEKIIMTPQMKGG